MLIILPLSSTFFTLKIFEFIACEVDPPGRIGGDADGTSGRVRIAVAIDKSSELLHLIVLP